MSHPMLATALAVVICWSLFALACSFVHEWIARIASERGRFFKKHIEQQLRDRPNDINWGYLMYRHSNLDLLQQRSAEPAAEIDPSLLARTFMDVVGNAAILKRELKEKHSETDLFGRLKAAPECLYQSDVLQMLSAQIGTINTSSDGAPALQQLETQLTNWFTQLNSQIGNWYARKTRKRLFLLGLSLALCFHIDSTALFMHFLNHEDARVLTTSYYEANREALETMATELSNGITPAPEEALELQQALQQQAQLAKLPIGFRQWMQVDWDWQSFDFWTMWLGFFITALASSIGAPFWFDALRKFYTKK